MRTVDPQNIKTDFLSGLSDIQATFSAASTSALSEKQKDLIAEYTFLGTAILLEGFIGDLLVAYINNKNKAFVKFLTKKMEITSSDDYSKRAKKISKISISSHLTEKKIRDILDPNNYNIAFSSSAELKKSAGLWLEPPFKSRYTSLTPQHSALLECTKAIRNYLAHRSLASSTQMQASLINPNLNINIKRGANKIHNVGSHLNSQVGNPQQHRLSVYLNEVIAIANHLHP